MLVSLLSSIMAKFMFSFDDLNIGEVPDKFSSSNKDFASFQGNIKEKPTGFYGTEDWGETGGIDSLSSDDGFYRDDSLEEGFGFSKHWPQQQLQQQPFTDYGLLDGVSFNAAASPPIQTCLEEISMLGQIINGIQDVAETKEKQYPSPLSSLGLLNNYGSGFKRLKGDIRKSDQGVNDMNHTEKADRRLSTEEVMRIAGEMFIQSNGQSIDRISMLNHPFNLLFSGLSDQETRDVELAVLLLAAAEKVSYQQYDHASRLLKQCDNMSFKTGNTVQRVVYYFAEALREKIERETGSSSSKGVRKPLLNFDEEMMRPSPTTLACQKELPFCQITQFAGIQAIVENVAEAKRIHIIDLAIRNGAQWTILMQALSLRYEFPLVLLKITAVATDSKHVIEGTGKRLLSFAQSLEIPFAFKTVIVSDMLNLKEDLFELDTEEMIAVYASYAFRRMLAMSNHIENIMRVIRVLNPCIMVVTEVEANHNSPIFVNRFIEVLFYFSAYFDCIATCLKQNCKVREIIESMFFGEGIWDMVAAEGEERKVRHVNFDVWRVFFVRYGMEEAELSMSSLYQVDLLLKKISCGSCCTLTMNGKCLLVGWKGTAMHSVSVWKFL